MERHREEGHRSDIATSQGASGPSKAGGGQKGPSLEALEGSQLADTSVSDSGLHNCGRNISIV